MWVTVDGLWPLRAELSKSSFQNMFCCLPMKWDKMSNSIFMRAMKRIDPLCKYILSKMSSILGAWRMHKRRDKTHKQVAHLEFQNLMSGCLAYPRHPHFESSISLVHLEFQRFEVRVPMTCNSDRSSSRPSRRSYTLSVLPFAFGFPFAGHLHHVTRKANRTRKS